MDWTMAESLTMALWLLLFVIGIWALSFPRSFLTFNRKCSRWVETGSIEQRLSDGSRSFDRLIYRHHILSGLLLLAGSLSLLYLILFRFSGGASWQDSGAGFTVLYESLLGIGCLAGIGGLVIGMIVLIRPSTLKLAEAWGNQTVSLQPFFDRLERRLTGLDHWVERHTRLFGTVVLLASIFPGLMLGW